MERKGLMYTIILIMLIMSLNFVYADLTGSTISYYKSDTDGSYPDEVGSYDGTINGATFSNGGGIIDSSYDFDGLNDYISTSMNIIQPSDYTLSFWFKSDDVTTAGRILHNGLTDASPHISIFVASGNLVYRFHNTIDYDISTAVSINTWYNVIATYNETSQRTELFLNSVSKGNRTSVGTITSWSGSEVNIGRRAGVGDQYYNGKVDELATYNTVLNRINIDFLYKNGTPTEDQQYPYSLAADIFKVTTNINTFNITVNGTYNYGTQNGTITTNILKNSSDLYNITLFPDLYYEKTYINYNVSSDLNYNFSFFNIDAKDNYSQNYINNFDVIINGSWIYNTTIGNVTVYIDEDLVNVSIFSDGYLIYNNPSHNTSSDLTAQLYNYSVNITFLDSNTSLAYAGENITVYYPSGYSEIKTTNENGTVFFDAFRNNQNEIGLYTFKVNTNVGYITPINYTTTINESNLPYNNTYTVDAAFFNITIKDVQTGLLINQTAVVTIAGVDQFTTTTGNLIIRNASIGAGSYVLTTFIAGYDLNVLNIDYTALEEKQVTVFMFNKTGANIGDWIITVLDPFYNTVLGADTRLLEYDPINDIYTEIDSCITNSIGRCVYSVEIGIKTYIARATKTIDGREFSAQSSELGEIIYFDQDEVNLFLNIEQDYYVSPEINLNVWYYNETLVNATGGSYLANISYLTAQFSDENSNTHTVCVDYYYLEGLSKVNAESNCASGISGIVNVVGGYSLDMSYTWIAEISTVQSEGAKKVLYSFRYQKNDSAEDQIGIYAKFVIILIFIIMLVLSLWLKNIIVFPIGTIAMQPFIILILPSFWDWKIASIIIFLCFILIYLTRKTESIQSV